MESTIPMAVSYTHLDVYKRQHLGYAHLDFRGRDILGLHEMMMAFAGYEYGGRYKTDDNVILEIDADGNRRVRFRPTPAIETPQAMEQLELAYMEARSDAHINQLLLIPCVILDFPVSYTHLDVYKRQ